MSTLFEPISIQNQARFVVRLLTTIVQYVEYSPAILKKLHTIAGQHLILGVTLDDYKQFAEAICQTFEKLSNDFTPKHRKVWMIAISQITQILLHMSQKLTEENLTGTVDLKMKREGSWKKYSISLSLNTLSVYKDEKLQKLKYTTPLSDIHSIDLFNPYEHTHTPSDYGLGLSLASTKMPYLWICTTENYAQIWRDEITWRRLEQ